MSRKGLVFSTDVSSKAICKLLHNLTNKLVIAQNIHTVIFLIVWTAGIIIQFKFTRVSHKKALDVPRHCGRWVNYNIGSRNSLVLVWEEN